MYVGVDWIGSCRDKIVNVLKEKDWCRNGALGYFGINWVERG